MRNPESIPSSSIHGCSPDFSVVSTNLKEEKEDRICGSRGKFGAVQNRFGISRRTLKVKQSRKMLGNEDRMKISTKGRYAVRVMLDLALNNNGECIKVKEIAARQGISKSIWSRSLLF